VFHIGSHNLYSGAVFSLPQVWDADRPFESGLVQLGTSSALV
jgi:hypothetical protein